MRNTSAYSLANWGAAIAAATLFATQPSYADVVTIDFDHYADGTPYVAPSLFSNAPSVGAMYSSLGVTFAPFQGVDLTPVILDRHAGFGVNPISGDNVLAFAGNTYAPFPTRSDGGLPIGPTYVWFDTPVTSVSFYESGLVQGSVAAYSADWTQSSGFKYVADESHKGWIHVTIGNPNLAVSYLLLPRTWDNPGTFGPWIIDDLTFTTPSTPVPLPGALPLAAVPIPACLYLFGPGIAGLGLARKRERTSGSNSTP